MLIQSPELLVAAALLAGCGPAVYYDVVTVEDGDPALADVRSSPEPNDDDDDDVRPGDADGDWRDAPRDMIPPVERMRTVRHIEDHPGVREHCLNTIQGARAHVSRAIESAKSIGDHQRLRCLSRRARELLTVRNMVLFSASGDGNGALACDSVPAIVDDARACR